MGNFEGTGFGMSELGEPSEAYGASTAGDETSFSNAIGETVISPSDKSAVSAHPEAVPLGTEAEEVPAPEIQGLSRHFDVLASDYDERTTARGWQSNAVFGAVLRDSACSPKTVLDLGAGTGSTIAKVLEQTNPERIVAVDLSAAMLEQLQRKYPDDNRFAYVESPVDTYVADAAGEGGFDLVTAISVIPFLSEPDAAMSGIAGHVAEGGLFVFTYDPIIPGHPMQGEAQELIRDDAADATVVIQRQHPQEIARAIQASGLLLVSDQPFSPLPASGLVARIVVAKRG